MRVVPGAGIPKIRHLQEIGFGGRWLAITVRVGEGRKALGSGRYPRPGFDSRPESDPLKVINRRMQ
jgi:hypothetical protein